MTNTVTLGHPVPDWAAPPSPARTPIEGDYCRLEPFSADRHAEALYRAYEGADHVWNYMPVGPFADLASYRVWAEQMEASEDPLFFTVVDKADGKPKGVASYLRINPAAGSIEVGHIAFSPLMQRTRVSTEAMYLFMRNAFELGYRRYEWKCNALNAPSRSLAMRIGLSYEGVFRQHMIVKGRNRDTAWYAAIDREWPLIQTAFETWLAAENFDAEGRQKKSLSGLTRPVLVNIG